MKKLLLHIGYPKTATTTLQEEVFVKLHEKGRINYLGRTTKSSHTRSGRSNFNGIDWVRHIRRHDNIGKSLIYDRSVLKSDIVNVMSDEDLTFHDFFIFAQFGVPKNHEDLPQRFKKLFGDDVDVSIVLTLRSQVDLIFSTYIQKLNYLNLFIGDYSFTDFLNNQYGYLERDVKSHLAIYDFNHIKNLWQSEFPSKISVLLFEDISNDQEAFCSELSKLIPATSAEILELTSKKHYRKRDKSNDYILVDYKNLSIFSRWITFFVNKDKFERFLLRRSYMRSSQMLKYRNRLVYKKGTIKVLKPTIEEQKFIKDLFNTSNIEFAKENNIDLKKMREYNYIN